MTSARRTSAKEAKEKRCSVKKMNKTLLFTPYTLGQIRPRETRPQRKTPLCCSGFIYDKKLLKITASLNRLVLLDLRLFTSPQRSRDAVTNEPCVLSAYIDKLNADER